MNALSRLLALVPVVLACWLLPAAPVLAQDDDIDEFEDSEMDEDIMIDAWSEGRLSRGDMESLARLLNMDAEQKTSAMDLFAAYDSAMKNAYKKLAEVQRSVYGEGDEYDPEAWQKLEPIFEKYNAHTEKLKTTFIEDLQLTLTDDQKALWPKFERWLLRKESMQGLMASGSRTDLIALTEQVMKGETWPDELTRVISEYEVDLDNVLGDAAKWRKEQEKAWRDAAKDFSKMSEEERMDYSRRMMQEGVARSRTVREVNMRYLKRIGDQIPENKRFGFEDKFYTQSFWGLSMYNINSAGSTAQRALETVAAAKEIGVTNDQQAKIDEIRREYENKRRADRDKMVARIIENEDNPKEGERGGMYGRLDMDPQEMADQWKKSREFEKATIEKLRAVLTPEQLAKLPPPLKERETPDLDEVDFEE